MTTQSNVLGDLAGRIREANLAARAASVLSAEKTIESGRLLLRAKEACAHGDWLPFLAQAGIEERTAQRHMKLAKAGLKSDMVSDLGGYTSVMDFLDEPALPAPGMMVVFMYRHIGLSMGWMWEDPEHPGYYHYRVNKLVAGGGGGHTTFSKRPMKAWRTMVDEQSRNILWDSFCDLMGCSVSSLTEMYREKLDMAEYPMSSWELQRREADERISEYD